MSLWRLNNRMTWKMVAVSFLAAAIPFCLFQLAASRAAHAGNHLSSANPTSKSSSNPLAAPAGTTYTWNGLVNNNWTVPANWTPIRAPTATSDILVFDGSSTPSPTVTNVPTEEIAELDLTNGALVTLKAETTVPAGDKTLTVSGGAGADRLKVPAGTSLTISGTTILNVSLAPNTTALVGGNVGLLNAAHKLTAASANAIKFASTSIFAAGHPSDTGFTGSPFGSGTDGSVVFQNGSSANFNEGSDPFGGNGHSVATFNLGSSQTFNTTTAFLSDGRTYGNLTLDGSQSYSGSGTDFLTVFNEFILKSGSSLTLSSSSGGNLNILGNFTDQNSSSTAFNANGRTVQFQGLGTQTITKSSGTEVFHYLAISKVNGTVQLNGNLSVLGPNGGDSVTFGSAASTLTLNGKTLTLGAHLATPPVGAGLVGDNNASLVLNDGGVTGDMGIVAMPTVNTLSSLTVNRTTSTGNATFRDGATINGSLTLTNGTVTITNPKVLLLGTAGAISRTNGYVIGNLQKGFGASISLFTFAVGTTNGYSPVEANVAAGTIGRSLTVKAVQGAQPNISGQALLRYWSLSNSGSVTADLTFHYLLTDVVGAEANYKFFKYNGSFTQFTPNATGVNSPQDHFASLNGVSSFSDWTLADPATVFGTLRIENAPYSIQEGNSGTTDVSIIVSRTGGSNGPVDVTYATADGTATLLDNDYLAASGTLHWNNGEMGNKSFVVKVVGDTTYEANETVNLTLSNPQGGATLGAPATTTLTINNDDNPPATLSVNTTDDVDNGFCLASHCSLREAINAANSNADTNTINFSFGGGDPGCSAGVCTISLATALPDLTSNMNINGPGANLITVWRSSSGLTPNFRIFTIPSGTVNISGLSISGGNPISGENGGGISNSGTLGLTNTTISGNTTNNGLGGGIFNNGGTLTLTNCTVSGNNTGTNGLSGGGVLNSSGTLTLTNSTVSGNTANGIVASGGGVLNRSGGTLTLTNSTVSGNAAGGSGGGGISNPGSGTTYLKNTIVANNTVPSGGASSDLDGTFNSQDYNLIGNTSGASFTGTFAHNITNVNALLGPLANNGGPTMTQALLPGSPAINSGDNCVVLASGSGGCLATPLTTDQRGAGFARQLNGTVDIGAFESRGFSISATSGTPQSATINAAFSSPLVATVSSAFGEPVSGGRVTFTAPASGASGTFAVNVSTTTVATNGSGVATSPTFTANGTAGGPYSVIASVGTGQPTAAFALTNLKAVTTTAVSSSANPSAPGQSVTFTATVSSSAGTPTGTVQFKDGGANLGAAQTLNASGVATFSTSSLTVGTHIITAEYSGDANFAASTGTLSGGQVVGSIINFSSANYSVNESDGFVTVTVNRTGDTSGAVTVNYATSDDSDANPLVPCAPTNPPGAVASSRCDFTTALGTVKFAAGEGSKTFRVLITQDSYVEGPEGFTITLSNLTGAAVLSTPSTATVTINNVAPASPGNAIDDTDIFVRQHYHDFLNREADTSGLNFWKNEITSCGSNAQCVEVKRINVSASFFLSIEFQQTGFLVERIYKAAYGDADGSSAIGEAHSLKVPVVRFLEFLSDSQQISQGVVVLQPGWDTVLEKNKSAFAADFVQRQRFASMYQTTMKPDVFVDALFANTGVTPSTADRDAAIGEFGSAMTTTDMAARGRALQRVAENDMLATQEFNRAFVLMEYFGYLRRNPNNLPDSDYSGYVFWLTKLNQFNGNYINAEMVKAFLSSTEYRQRFGP